MNHINAHVNAHVKDTTEISLFLFLLYEVQMRIQILELKEGANATFVSDFEPPEW